jgi:hypothetical protein
LQNIVGHNPTKENYVEEISYIFRRFQTDFGAEVLSLGLNTPEHEADDPLHSGG